MAIIIEKAKTTDAEAILNKKATVKGKELLNDGSG